MTSYKHSADVKDFGLKFSKFTDTAVFENPSLSCQQKR